MLVDETDFRGEIIFVDVLGEEASGVAFGSVSRRGRRRAAHDAPSPPMIRTAGLSLAAAGVLLPSWTAMASAQERPGKGKCVDERCRAAGERICTRQGKALCVSEMAGRSTERKLDVVKQDRLSGSVSGAGRTCRGRYAGDWRGLWVWVCVSHRWTRGASAGSGGNWAGQCR